MTPSSQLEAAGAATASEASLVALLAAWSTQPVAAAFPMQSVLDAVWTHGQHFLAGGLLAALDGARRAADRALGSAAELHLLRTFLATVLDKYDEQYDYASYLGLALFELAPPGRGGDHRRERDAWLALLVADALRFERETLAGARAHLPELRPAPELARKRMRLAARVLAPVAARLGLEPAAAGNDLADAVFAAAARSRQAQLLALAPSMQPVYVMHDEYLFIRVLQSLEVTFTALRRSAEDALSALRRGAFAAAAGALGLCAELLDESQSFFSLLATMQAEAFRSFRRFTEGASAIQSVNYKTFELLCATPPAERLASPAFTAVPAVRRRALAGADNIADAFAAAELGESDRALLLAAMANLETVHDRWKQTHYKLALRMIGAATGTGYTAGTPYLRAVLANRLFRPAPRPAETSP